VDYDDAVDYVNINMDEIMKAVYKLADEVYCKSKIGQDEVIQDMIVEEILSRKNDI